MWACRSGAVEGSDTDVQQCNYAGTRKRTHAEDQVTRLLCFSDAVVGVRHGVVVLENVADQVRKRVALGEVRFRAERVVGEADADFGDGLVAQKGRGQEQRCRAQRQRQQQHNNNNSSSNDKNKK